MCGWRHCNHTASEALPKCRDALGGSRRFVSGRGQDGQPSIEEIGAGVLHAILLRSGERMRGNECDAVRQRIADGLDDPEFRAAAIREDGAVLAMRGRREDRFRDAIHRRANDDEVRFPSGFNQAGCPAIDGAELLGSLEAPRIAA